MFAVNHSRDRSVQGMFDRIAGRYDLLNHVISFRLDARWRRQAIRAVVTQEKPRIIDLGTGTGDLTLNAAAMAEGKGTFIGLDFSLPMLKLAQAKKNHEAHGASAAFVMGSAMFSPFKSGRFDGALTAFVLRNVSDLPLFFAEALRVLKPGGRLVSLDMFPPDPGWFAAVYSVYFYSFMPRVGGWLAGDRSAYQYLSDSVCRFHSPAKVAQMIRDAGFEQVTTKKFLRGAVCMHVAEKPHDPSSN